VGGNHPFSSFKRQYVENGRRYSLRLKLQLVTEITYVLSIDAKIDDLELRKVKFWRNFAILGANGG